MLFVTYLQRVGQHHILGKVSTEWEISFNSTHSSLLEHLSFI